MQAIILAAGMGKRLGELTKDNTKSMIKVHSKTLIERMIDQLCRVGVSRIVLVIGYKGEKVKTLIGSKINNVPVIYVENSSYAKTNNIYSLFMAKGYLEEDDTILLESDLIFSDSILEKVVGSHHPNLAVVAKYQSWMDGTVVTLDEEDNILNFLGKKAFCFEDKESYYKTVNIYKFSKAFSRNKYVPFLDAYCKALGNNEYYEQVLRVISLLDKPDLKALRISDDKWYEIDDQQDLANAEALFADEENALSAYSKRYGGYWRFPQLLDFCYLVNPYFPSRRMKDEMKANFEILLTEYPSGMGVNASLAARYCDVDTDQIVVGNGAAELIQCYLRLYPVKTGIILPTFEEYPNRLSEEQIVYYTPDNNDFSYSSSDIIAFYEKQPIRQLVLINPDNPSGNLLSKAELLRLIDWAKEMDIRLIIDESFSDFSDPSFYISLFDKKILNCNPHLILVKSISKSYGVPGLRLGFLASGDTELIRSLKKEVSIWNINSFAEFYMQIFIKYQEDYNKARLSFIQERDRFYGKLQTISFLRTIPSAANYFLCEVTDCFTSTELCSLLLNRYNILLKDCSTKTGFNKKSYIRVAIRNTNDNDELIHALRQLN